MAVALTGRQVVLVERAEQVAVVQVDRRVQMEQQEPPIRVEAVGARVARQHSPMEATAVQGVRAS